MTSNHPCRNSKQSNVKELWWRTLVLVKLWWPHCSQEKEMEGLKGKGRSWGLSKEGFKDRLWI